DQQVLAQKLGIVALGEPFRLPVLHDPESEPDRMCLLTHDSSFVATRTDTWLMRLSSGVARPCARGSQRLSVGPAPTRASLTYRSSRRTRPSCSALATDDSRTL